MVRIVIEVDEERADDSLRDRLERGVKRDESILRRLRDEDLRVPSCG